RAEYGSGSTVSAVKPQYRSTASSVVSVSKDGWVKATGQGNALIVASYNGYADTARIKVGNIPTGSLRIKNDVDSIAAVGGTVRLFSEVLDPSGEPVLNPRITWTSLTPQIASVSGGAGVAT